jgi:hypothetical protein
MKKLGSLLFIFVVIMSFQITVFADEGHEDEDIILEEADHESQPSEAENHGKENDHIDGTPALKEHSDSNDHHEEASKDTGASSHDDLDSSHGHGEEQAGLDESPNYKVLGTFGAINFFFLLIGAWNKLIRRKCENDGRS